MKKRYVQRNGELVLIEPFYKRIHLVQDDMRPVQSAMDGEVIGSRSKLREYEKRHGVVRYEDTESEVATKARERERFYSGEPYDVKTRREALIFATDLESAERTSADKAQMVENFRNRND